MKHNYLRSLFFFILLLSGCTGQPRNDSATVHSTTIKTAGAVSLRGEAWADNWFAFYLGEKLLVEDSVPITTERSFNAEIFTFTADYPLHFNFILKDFKENDTGLEYIKTSRQQMGDGGFIAQFTDIKSGKLLAVSDASWKCTVIHTAPLDKACAKVSDPVAGEGACGFSALDEPIGWKRADFDDSDWATATVYTAAEVSPKDGYDAINWQPAAKLIWGADLQTDNTLLCRVTVAAP
ncbi:hypothetical protein BH10CHL1_BH10CHL1_32430 [soil metagenome]